MPRLPECAFGRLSADATLTELVGSGTDCRIYEGLAPQKPTYPFVVVEMEDESRPHQFGAVPSLAEARLRYTTYSKTNAAAADEIADAIYGSLMGGEEFYDVQACNFEDRNHSVEWDMDAAHRVFVTALQFRFYFNP